MNISDDDEKTMIIIIIALFLLEYFPVKLKRSPFVMKRPRLNWESTSYFNFRNDKNTIRTLRMHPDSFDKLVEALRPQLTRNAKMASLRGGVYSPEVRLFITIRYLCGAQVLDLMELVGGSKAALNQIIWSTIGAIIQSKHELLDNIHFPKTADECRVAADGFTSKSTKMAITNCVGVIDGYLLKIRCPPKRVVGNVKSYFSGHYQTYGVNIQAACDEECRFTYIGVAGPGSMADSKAINEISLGKLVDSLPRGYVCIADCAYTASEKMASIYYGARLLANAKYDHFNYYASQLRIRIEMAFGLMQAKWIILETSNRCNIRNVKGLVIAIARLHNFCINERLHESVATAKKKRGLYTTTTQHQKNGTPIVTDEEGIRVRHIPGMSMMRENMVTLIMEKGLTRPRRQK